MTTSVQRRISLASRHLRYPLILVLVVVGFYWKLTLTNQFTVWNDPDDAQQVLPWLAFEARQFRHATLPLWDPHSWGGQSLIGQGQPGVCFPLNWLLFLIGFGRQSLASVLHRTNLYYVAIHILGALFMYALTRELGRGRFASILSGLAFTASAYMATITWPQKLNGAVWTPLIFLFFIRVWRGEGTIRNAAFSGACLGAAFLSGHHEAPMFMGLAVAGSWIWILWESRRHSRFKPLLAGLGMFCLLTLLISAFQVIPEVEYGRLALRWLSGNQMVDWQQKVPYSVHAEYSLGVRSLIGIVLPWFSEHGTPFLGWGLLTLAAIGLAQFWALREVKLFFAVGLGGLLFSLGKNNTLHGLIYGAVPMMEKARSAGFAILLFGFGAAVLLAYGVDGLVDFGLTKRRWRRRALRLLLGAAVLLGVCTILAVAFNSQTMDSNFMALSGFSALCCAGILYATWNQSIHLRTTYTLLALVIVLELGNIAPPAFATIDQGWKFLEPLNKYSDVAEFMRAQKGGARIEVDSTAIPFNFGDWYGVDTFNAYLASLSKNVFWVYSQNAHWCRMLFATAYYAGTKPQSPEDSPVFSSKDGVTVYRARDALPRVWIAHRVAAVSQAEGAARLRTGATLRNEVFTFGKAPPLESCASRDEAQVVSLAINQEVFSAKTSCRSLLVAAATYYPGWRASVDGSPAEIMEVDGALRAIEIPAGRHTVIFQYRPRTVISGFVLGLMGVAIVLWLAFGRRRITADNLSW